MMIEGQVWTQASSSHTLYPLRCESHHVCISQFMCGCIYVLCNADWCLYLTKYQWFQTHKETQYCLRVTQERLCSIFGAMFEPSYVQRTCFEVLDFLRRLFEMCDPDRIRWQNLEREIMLYLSPWYRPGGTRISMVSTRWAKHLHGDMSNEILTMPKNKCDILDA